jgi:hypothetical protein
VWAVGGGQTRRGEGLEAKASCGIDDSGVAEQASSSTEWRAAEC